jgi:hypothetical protein
MLDAGVNGMRSSWGGRLAAFRCGAVLAVALGAGCGEAGSSFLAAAQGKRPPPPRVAPKGYLPPDAAKTITLEFDAADDILKQSNGAFTVSAFQVGFFDGAQLVRALEIPRSAAQIDGTRVRLQVPLIPLAPGAKSGSVTVRVRGLSSGPLGQWSASAGSVTLPIQERLERERSGRDRNAARADRRNRAVTVEQLTRFPALKEALAAVLGDASEEEVLSSCATVQDLATAVVVARKHELAPARVCAAMRERSSGALEELLKSAKPPAAPAQLRAARAEARTLTRERRAGADAKEKPNGR